jgi:hypothetical protein
MCLPIDVVAYAHPDTSSDDLSEYMVGAICNQLDAFYGILIDSKV